MVLPGDETLGRVTAKAASAAPSTSKEEAPKTSKDIEDDDIKSVGMDENDVRALKEAERCQEHGESVVTVWNDPVKFQPYINSLAKSLKKRESVLGRYNYITAQSYEAIANVYRQADHPRSIVMYRVCYRIHAFLYGKCNGHISGHFKENLIGRGLILTDIGDIQNSVIASVRLEMEGDVLRRQGDRKGAMVEYQKAAKLEELAFGRDNPDLAYIWRKIACLMSMKKPLFHAVVDFEDADRIGSKWLKQVREYLSPAGCALIKRGDRFYEELLYGHAAREYFKVSALEGIDSTARKGKQSNKNSNNNSSSNTKDSNSGHRRNRSNRSTPKGGTKTASKDLTKELQLLLAGKLPANPPVAEKGEKHLHDSSSTDIIAAHSTGASPRTRSKKTRRQSKPNEPEKGKPAASVTTAAVMTTTTSPKPSNLIPSDSRDQASTPSQPREEQQEPRPSIFGPTASTHGPSKEQTRKLHQSATITDPPLVSPKTGNTGGSVQTLEEAKIQKMIVDGSSNDPGSQQPMVRAASTTKDERILASPSYSKPREKLYNVPPSAVTTDDVNVNNGSIDGDPKCTIIDSSREVVVDTSSPGPKKKDSATVRRKPPTTSFSSSERTSSTAKKPKSESYLSRIASKTKKMARKQLKRAKSSSKERKKPKSASSIFGYYTRNLNQSSSSNSSRRGRRSSLSSQMGEEEQLQDGWTAKRRDKKDRKSQSTSSILPILLGQRPETPGTMLSPDEVENFLKDAIESSDSIRSLPVVESPKTSDDNKQSNKYSADEKMASNRHSKGAADVGVSSTQLPNASPSKRRTLAPPSKKNLTVNDEDSFNNSQPSVIFEDTTEGSSPEGGGSLLQTDSSRDNHLSQKMTKTTLADAAKHEDMMLDMLLSAESEQNAKPSMMEEESNIEIAHSGHNDDNNTHQKGEEEEEDAEGGQEYASDTESVLTSDESIKEQFLSTSTKISSSMLESTKEPSSLVDLVTNIQTMSSLLQRQTLRLKYKLRDRQHNNDNNKSSGDRTTSAAIDRKNRNRKEERDLVQKQRRRRRQYQQQDINDNDPDDEEGQKPVSSRSTIDLCKEIEGLFGECDSTLELAFARLDDDDENDISGPVNDEDGRTTASTMEEYRKTFTLEKMFVENLRQGVTKILDRHYTNDVLQNDDGTATDTTTNITDTANNVEVVVVGDHHHNDGYDDVEVEFFDDSGYMMTEGYDDDDGEVDGDYDIDY